MGLRFDITRRIIQESCDREETSVKVIIPALQRKGVRSQGGNAAHLKIGECYLFMACSGSKGLGEAIPCWAYVMFLLGRSGFSHSALSMA